MMKNRREEMGSPVKGGISYQMAAGGDCLM